ncbi:MAG: EamA family transporter [Leptothrix sp. (in: Bacteria)]|nr:EamA family transporter [Leptothrix sp. (in: b-proteobacteria)]
MNTTLQALVRPTSWFAWPTVSPRWLGALAVLLFAMTIPMTRLANGSVDLPQLPPLFVAVARGAIAGLLAMGYLWVVRAPRPVKAQWPLVACVVVGAVLIFPLCMGWAVRVVPSAHAAVIVGLLPLCTAALASWWLGQQPGWGFWLAGAMGTALVLGFALGVARSHGTDHWVTADAWLIVSMLGASLAYVAGAALSRQMPAPQAISWALVAALPITLPATAWAWPTQAVNWQAWAALAYVALISTWLGFFAWYAALARDPMRVSQLQLMQPFTSIALSVLVLREVVDASTWLVAGAVLLVVIWGQRAARREMN